MEVKRSFDLLSRYEQNFDKEDALAGKKDGEWIKYSTRDYINRVNWLSYAFLSMGVKKGEKIATITNNRPEWNFLDLALSQVGAIHVPIYPTIGSEEYEYIFNHCEAKIVFVGTKIIFNKIEPLTEKSKFIEQIYTVDEVEGQLNLDELFELGKRKEEEYKSQLEKIKNSIKETDCVTLIYTSGTTGMPKGVMLSHRNLMSNAIATTVAHDLGFEHRAISFLPLCHVYERMMNYHFQYKGIGIYYVSNLGAIAQNIKEVKPHIFNTVPRLLERVYDGIIGKGKNLPTVSKWIFFWAVRLGLKFDPYKQSLFYKLRLKLARKLIFSKWIDGLGGELKAIVSGGAALQSRLEKIFWAAGIRIAEGYGLTETSPVIAVNHIYEPNVKFGTVGKILGGVEAKISDDGEILTRGPHIMMGYYKAPDLTKEVIDEDGWFHTGDIGHIDEDGFLKITDRKKEMFKTSSGKYIAPQAIENKMKESFFIEQAMVIGENEKFASALISPNFNFLHDWASKHKIQYRDNKELVQTQEVVARYQREIHTVNKVLGDHEQIKRFRLVCDEWSPQTGELSPTLKLKRNKVANSYAEIIAQIYGHDKESEDGPKLTKLAGDLKNTLIKKVGIGSDQN